MNHDELMTSPDAARFLRLEPQTLRSWRVQGRGPRYIRISGTRVAYRRDELDRWISEREFGSTAEEGIGAL